MVTIDRTTGRGRGVLTTASSTVPRTMRSLPLWIAVGTLGSIGMVLTGSAIGSVPHPRGDLWWFTVSTGKGVPAHLAFYACVALLVAGWAGVGVHAYRGRLTVPLAWVVLALWSLPFLLGTPLFSRDLYSYVAQGQLARSGLNPYLVAPSALGPGNVLASVATVWHNTASPYGPIFVSLSHLGSSLGGASLVAQIMVLRAMELVGVALMMVSLPVLARRLGTDPGLALWLGVLSPLALFSFVSSGHNDALMLGLMLAGIVLGTGGRLRWGIALCALAATIKLPAAAALVFMVADECTRTEGARRVRVVAEAVLITVVVVVGVTWAAGFGWTWLGPTALKVPTELKVLITPMVSLASFLGGVLHAVGVPIAQHTAISVVQTVASLVAVVAIAWMVLHVRGRDVVRLTGLALLLFVVLSPTVWPWYLLWGIVVLAATPLQRSKVLAVVAGLAMLVVGAGGTPMFNGGDYWVTGPLVAAGLLWFVQSGAWRTVLDGTANAA
jgi:hypothetical protein